MMQLCYNYIYVCSKFWKITEFEKKNWIISNKKKNHILLSQAIICKEDKAPKLRFAHKENLSVSWNPQRLLSLNF